MTLERPGVEERVEFWEPESGVLKGALAGVESHCERLPCLLSCPLSVGRDGLALWTEWRDDGEAVGSSVRLALPVGEVGREAPRVEAPGPAKDIIDWHFGLQHLRQARPSSDSAVYSVWKK